MRSETVISGRQACGLVGKCLVAILGAGHHFRLSRPKFATASAAVALVIKLSNSCAAENEADRIGVELNAKTDYDTHAAKDSLPYDRKVSDHNPPHVFGTHSLSADLEQVLRAPVPNMLPSMKTARSCQYSSFDGRVNFGSAEKLRIATFQCWFRSESINFISLSFSKSARHQVSVIPRCQFGGGSKNRLPPPCLHYNDNLDYNRTTGKDLDRRRLSAMHEVIKQQAYQYIRHGRLVEARKLMSAVCSDDCDDADAWSLLGAICGQLGVFDDSVLCLERSLVCRDGAAHIYFNLGQAYYQLRRYQNAVQAYKAALAPDNPVAYKNLGTALKLQGDSVAAIDMFRHALSVKADLDDVHSNLVYALNNIPGCDPEYIYNEHRLWDTTQTRGLVPFTGHKNERDPNRNLKVGYLSPDFRRHSVTCFFEPLLDNHDRSRVTAICYSNVQNPDRTTARLQQKADVWRDIARLTDEAAAELIRSEGIDILVDLAGHTAGNRLKVFARRPAPVQVSCIGYPVTTGLRTIDYRLTDNWIDPQGTTERYNSEKLVRIPGGLHCYRTPALIPETSSLPEDTNGYITFGTFCNRAKINDAVIAVWVDLLNRVPDSRLFVKSSAFCDSATGNILANAFSRQGIDPARIELHGIVDSFEQHLALYSKLDIALDTFPYNGVTTTCEALWMSVPVIVLSGETAASRYGASLLNQLDMLDFVADNTKQYVQLANSLADDRERRRRLRQGLRDRMRASPLCDEKGYARKIEDAYVFMWRNWCDEPIP